MGTNKNMRIYLMVVVMIGCCVKVPRAVTDSCQVSKETVDIVDDCPDTMEKWTEAAARKNCEAYARRCDEPDRFVYHCVINAFINQTLEVCAYRRVIVLGFCTEYSFGGNVIQQNFKANCTKFTHNPCPSSYPSTDAYKYPGCYEMTKKTTARPATITTPSTVNATNMNNEKQANEGSSTGILLPIALVVLGVTVFIVCLYIWRRRKKMFCMKKDWNRTNEEESSRALEPLNTETEKMKIAPSELCNGNGLPNSAPQ